MQNINKYPCHFTPSVSAEQFIPEHFFSYLVTGTMIVYDGDKEYIFEPGDYCFAQRNHLAKYTKRFINGEFKTISIFFDQDFLKGFSNEYGVKATGLVAKQAIKKLEPNPLFENYIQSLKPYIGLDGVESDNFLSLKNREIVLILLKTNPELKNILFDFSDPGKIDLEEFMNRNFRFNVGLERFGYLTGRSLTTFKRDFEKIFHNSPGRWLLEKRLQEAHHLLEREGRKPNDVYLETGFEDLSHFSFAFKNKYGISPNQLKRLA